MFRRVGVVGIATAMTVFLACEDYGSRYREMRPLFAEECDWLVRCADAYDNRPDCEDARWEDFGYPEGEPYPPCVFDARAAFDCEEALRQLTCDDDLYEDGHPEVCLRLWTDCDTPAGMPPLE